MPDTNSHATTGQPDIFARLARINRNISRPVSVAVQVPPVGQPSTRQSDAPSVMARLTGRAQPKVAPSAEPAAGSSLPKAGGSLFERMRAFAPADAEAPPRSGGDDVDEDAGGVAAANVPRGETIRGLVERTQVFNGTWGVAHIWTEDRKSVKVTGDIVGGLKDGLSYEFEGGFRTGPHGESFIAALAKPHLDCDRKAIVRFIARSFKGVGERTADKFLDQQLKAAAAQGRAEPELLEEIRKTLVTSPWTLDLSGVTKKGQYDGEHSEMMVEAVKRDLATRVGQYEGMKEPVLKALASWLMTQQLAAGDRRTRDKGISPDVVEKCWARLATNPYVPIRDVLGYGFKSADALGRALNIPKEDPKRLGALAAYAISTACSSGGHMFLTAEQMAEAVKRADPAVSFAEVIKAGVASEDIAEVRVGGDGAAATHIYYEAELKDIEESLAKRLATMLSDRCKPLSKDTPQQLREKLQATAKRLNPNLAKGLDESQLDALVGILTSRTRLHTITAGPGCGKTSIMEVLTAHLGAERFDYCAPTGRAALVLSNRLSEVGGSASTIHSLFKGGGREFQVNEENPLESEILVVDEGSMPPTSLWDAILAGLNESQHAIVLGDVGQLPSIEPGVVLEDLMRMAQVDKHRLKSSHRAAGGLLEILAQLDKGTIDCVDRDDVKFSHGLPSAQNGFDLVAQEYVEAVGEFGYSQVALLMSRRKGDAAKPDWNVTYANARLRELCNPNAPKIPGTRFHLNDRVIFRENLKVPRGTNDPDEGSDGEDAAAPSSKVSVVNGDTGTITGFTKGKGNISGAKWVRVKLDDGRDVHYPMDSSIDHAYAITVHSAQGGEYRRVIAVVTPGHESFVNRVMLRTQLSRARQLMKVHADDAVLRKVAATPMPPRNSRLVELVDKFTAEGEESDENDEPVRERCSA